MSILSEIINVSTDMVKSTAERLTKKQIKGHRIPKYMYCKKPYYSDLSQFPWRCPYCLEKFIIKEQAIACMEECSKTFADKVWKYLEDNAIKEAGSWQWDLDDQHIDWVGVVKYFDNTMKYFKTKDRQIIFIELKELVELLKKGCYLHQKNEFDLPEELKEFANVKWCYEIRNDKVEKLYPGTLISQLYGK